MKNVLMIVLAFLAILFLWGIITTVVHVVLGWIIRVAMIALFCWLVYAVYKLMTREKSVY